MHVYPNDGHPETYPRPRMTMEDVHQAAASLGVQVVKRSLVVGDLFLAGRNTGVKLLTVSHVHPKQWVESIEGYYPFDIWECFPIEEITSDESRKDN